MKSFYYSVKIVAFCFFISGLKGCASEYKLLKETAPDQECIDKIKPKGISTSWYNASIDVLQHHFSGLLFLKEMPDDATRIVFTNEAGVTFFDFQFDAKGQFSVKYVIQQLNKKSVINTLKTDFELMLGLPFRDNRVKAWRADEKVFYGVQHKNETAYFVTDSQCLTLEYLELGSARKKKVEIRFAGNNPTEPDSVTIKHLTFAMNIALKKLTKDVTE